MGRVARRKGGRATGRVGQSGGAAGGSAALKREKRAADLPLSLFPAIILQNEIRFSTSMTNRQLNTIVLHLYMISLNRHKKEGLFSHRKHRGIEGKTKKCEHQKKRNKKKCSFTSGMFIRKEPRHLRGVINTKNNVWNKKTVSLEVSRRWLTHFN